MEVHGVGGSMTWNLRLPVKNPLLNHGKTNAFMKVSWVFLWGFFFPKRKTLMLMILLKMANKDGKFQNFPSFFMFNILHFLYRIVT